MHLEVAVSLLMTLAMIPRNFQQDPLNRPKKNLSNYLICSSNLLRGPLVRSHSIFDGMLLLLLLLLMMMMMMMILKIPILEMNFLNSILFCIGPVVSFFANIS